MKPEKNALEGITEKKGKILAGKEVPSWLKDKTTNHRWNQSMHINAVFRKPLKKKPSSNHLIAQFG